MLDLVIDTRCRDLGGFVVGRVLPFRKRRMVGPFIFFDRMGPHDMPVPIPRETDVRPHPHIGLSTVTYLFDGQLTHRDSLGVEQVILPGALNWMTAGRGITHSERFDGMRNKGGCMDGIQTWVALPDENEEDAPAFDHHAVDTLPTFDDDGVSGRVIAGSAFGIESPATTHSPLFYVHAEMQADARISPPEGYAERAAFVAAGSIEVGGRQYEPGQMLVFSSGAAPTLRGVEATRLMLLGGEPVGPRYIWWNFVSSSKERIEDARRTGAPAASRCRRTTTKSSSRCPTSPRQRRTRCRERQVSFTAAECVLIGVKQEGAPNGHKTSGAKEHHEAASGSRFSG